MRKVVDNIGVFDAWAAEEGYPTHNLVPIIGCKFTDMIHDGKMTRDELVDLGAVAAGAQIGGATTTRSSSSGSVACRSRTSRGNHSLPHRARQGYRNPLNLWQSRRWPDLSGRSPTRNERNTWTPRSWWSGSVPQARWHWAAGQTRSEGARCRTVRHRARTRLLCRRFAAVPPTVHEGPRYVPMLQRARELWFELEAETGRHLYDECGALQIGPAGSGSLANSLACAQQYGLPYALLDADALRARYPQHRVEDTDAAVLDLRAGSLYPEASVFAAVQAAKTHGAQVATNTEVLDFDEEGGRLRPHTRRTDHLREGGRRHRLMDHAVAP